MTDKILVIGPHSDDMEFGCAGYVCKRAAQGAEVQSIIVGVSDMYSNALGVWVPASRRIKESEQAAKRLGVASVRVLLNGLDGELDTVSIKKVIGLIEEIVDEYQPNEVLIPLASSHQDHEVTYKACMAALRPTVLPNTVELIAGYEYPLTGWGAAAGAPRGFGEMYVDVTAEFDAKVEALMCHETQIRPGCYSLHGARVMAEYRGMECGADKAELLYVIRKIIRP